MVIKEGCTDADIIIPSTATPAECMGLPARLAQLWIPAITKAVFRTRVLALGYDIASLVWSKYFSLNSVGRAF